MDDVPEPTWLVAANVVRWRRYGDLGQEFRPGTKAFRGRAKVYVLDTYPGTADEQLTAVGHGRHTGWITIDTGTRHLHTFRPQLVYSPAVLRRCAAASSRTREEAVVLAERLDGIACHGRHTYHSAPHPDPCLCHECLPVSPG
ncbi:hypothetical protein AB0890_25840 [Streptomyces sp. NPDC005406]|uniref:hypothetical protein n=1 Tax=Streptomyces sp. NPDC005406 TaxID=3155339 RepID=UPI003451F65D